MSLGSLSVCLSVCLTVCLSVSLPVTEHRGVTQALDVLRKELAAERASGLELLAQVKAMLAGNSEQLAQVASTCICTAIKPTLPVNRHRQSVVIYAYPQLTTFSRLGHVEPPFSRCPPNLVHFDTSPHLGCNILAGGVTL